jgi:Phosphatidylinositol-4-phosphate 5-kinase
MSFDVEKNRGMVFKAGQGAGKSGSFFFFSHDNKFIIKTLKGNEK